MSAVECHSKILQTSREVRSQPRADGSSTARQITGSRVRKSATTGDDRSVKIKTLEAAKLTEIKWLVLGYIDADFLYRCRFCNYIVYTRSKALTRSIRFTFLCTSTTSTIQQIFFMNLDDFFHTFSNDVVNILQFSCRFVLKLRQILCRKQFCRNFTDCPENASTHRKSEEHPWIVLILRDKII